MNKPSMQGIPMCSCKLIMIQINRIRAEPIFICANPSCLYFAQPFSFPELALRKTVLNDPETSLQIKGWTGIEPKKRTLTLEEFIPTQGY